MSKTLNKRVAIARSGVYEYRAEEIPRLGLSVPPEFKGRGSFGVYRPATVLADSAKLFVNLPVTLEHPSEKVDGGNFKKYASGFTGSNSKVTLIKDTNEVAVESSLTLIDSDAVNSYYRGVVEVSPGYNASFMWKPGVSPNGEPYDIVMTEIKEVNHLALTRRGRGGKYACILDSKGVSMRKRSSGLFYAVRKALGGVQDSGEGSFTERLSKIITERTSLSEAELAQRIDDLKLVVDYLPGSEDKDKLDRFLEDMKLIKDETDQSCEQYALMIGNLFYTLDKAATEDGTVDSVEKPAEEKPEQKPEEAVVEDDDKNGEKEEPSEKSEEPEKKDQAGEDKKEDESGENSDEKTSEEGGSETVPDDVVEEPSIGPDDSIFDKPEQDLTPEEKSYIHSKLMCMLKEHLQHEASETPVEEAEEHAENTETAEDDAKKPAPEDKKEEEPTEPKKDTEDSIEEKSVEDSAPEPWSKTVKMPELGSSSGERPFSLSEFIRKDIKGGK